VHPVRYKNTPPPPPHPRNLEADNFPSAVSNCGERSAAPPPLFGDVNAVSDSGMRRKELERTRPPPPSPDDVAGPSTKRDTGRAAPGRCWEDEPRKRDIFGVRRARSLVGRDAAAEENTAGESRGVRDDSPVRTERANGSRSILPCTVNFLES
jgi:hypothetical protein